MTFTDFDLSTAVLPHGNAVYDSGVITAAAEGFFDFIFPGFVLDPTTTYEIQVEFTDDGGSTFLAMQSATGDTEADYDAASWYGLASNFAPSSPCTLTAGPGLEQWDGAVADGDIYVIFSGESGMAISAVRWQAVDTPPPAAPDFGNVLRGRRRGGTATGQVTPPIAPPLATAPVRVDKAIALPVPTMVNGRPT